VSNTAEAPEPEEIQFWTRKAFEQLLALPALPDGRFGRYLTDVTSGKRDGEVLGGQFKHVALEDSIPYWRVVQQLIVAREGKPPELDAPKSKWGKRTIPLHPLATAWLRWWKKKGLARYVGRKPTDEDYARSGTRSRRGCKTRMSRATSWIDYSAKRRRRRVPSTTLHRVSQPWLAR
jgi:hypothetical protein